MRPLLDVISALLIKYRLGNKSGTFNALYKANRAESIGRALESSPVAVAVCEMVDNHGLTNTDVFHGTVKSLLEKLSAYRHDTENWPRSPKGLSDTLKRQAPALAALGIEIITGSRIERIGGNRGLTITIKKTGNVGNMEQKLSVQKSFFQPKTDVERF